MRGGLLLLFSMCGIVALADDAVSPAFTFDARYQPSGVTPDAWVAYKAEGLSSRFSRSGSKTGLSADADDDGDGFSNYGEFVAYTNPTNGQSKFVIGLNRISVEPVLTKSAAVRRLLNADPADSDYQLVWQSAEGRTYSVYCTSDLKSGFGDAPLAEIEGTGEEIKYSPSVSGDALFFKVKVRLAK